MQLVKDTFIQSDLEYTWPSLVRPQRLVGISWRGQRLTHFSNTQSLNFLDFDPSTTSLLKVLQLELPWITLMERARLAQRLLRLQWNEEAAQVAQFSLGENEALYTVLLALPANLQAKIAETQMTAKDVNFLSYLNANPEAITGDLMQVLEVLGDFLLSKSHLQQTLEWCLDLCFMNNSKSTLAACKSSKSADQLVQNLRALRYPLTTSSDESKHRKLKGLPWPKDSEVKWTRRGDVSGIEFKTLIQNENDFLKVGASLQRVHDAKFDFEN